MSEAVNHIRKLNKILQDYKSGKANLERRIIDSEQWWKLHHNDWQNDGPVDGTSAWLSNVIMTKHADAMDAYPTCTCLPHEPGDQQEAQMLSSIIPVVLRQTKFEDTYSNVWWYKLKSGTGCYKVIWDGSKHNGLGDIDIRKVNILNLYWQPGVENIQDSAYVFHVELVDNERLEAQYPQLTGKLNGAGSLTVNKFIYDDHVNTDDKSLVVDCYYKREGTLHYVKYVSEEILYSTESIGAEPQDALQATPAPGDADMGMEPTPAMQMQELAFQPAAKGLYDHGMYPFVLDVLFPTEGSCCGYGYIDYGKTTQLYIDKLNGAILQNALASARPRVFVRQDGGVNEAEFLDVTKPVVHVSGNMGEDSIKAIDPIPLPGIYENVLQGRIQELKETLGNRDASSGGVTASVTSAAGIASLQEAAGKLSRDAEKASYRAFEQIVYLCIELIRQFYTVPRNFRITGKNGEQQFVQYGNAGIAPQQTMMGLRKPEFDIDVQAQKENPYTKESYNELAVQLYQMGVFNPEMANQALMMLDIMDFKGKDALIPKIQQQNQFMQVVQQAMMVMQQQAMQQGMAPAVAPGEEPEQPTPPQGNADSELTGGHSDNPADHASPRKAREQARAASQPR